MIQTDNLYSKTSHQRIVKTTLKKMMKIIFYVESWKDCHKSYSNPFEGGLQCVFEEVALINDLFSHRVISLLFSHRATLVIASTASAALFQSLDSLTTVPSPLSKNKWLRNTIYQKYPLSSSIINMLLSLLKNNQHVMILARVLLC